jgi:hypothetical protein
MTAPYVVTGTLSTGRLVELDEALPLGDAKVRVSIEPITADRPRSEPAESADSEPGASGHGEDASRDARQPARKARPVLEVLAEIHAEQEARGHIPPTREEVDRYLAEERASWDR